MTACCSLAGYALQAPGSVVPGRRRRSRRSLLRRWLDRLKQMGRIRSEIPVALLAVAALVFGLSLRAQPWRDAPAAALPADSAVQASGAAQAALASHAPRIP